MNISCSHFARCSGCVIDSCHEPPEIFHRARLFLQQHYGLSLTRAVGAIRGWRTRAKLAVRHNALRPEKPRIGLFEKGSHNVLPIPHCQVHHPRINQAVEVFLDMFARSKLTAYDEIAHTGDLRYLQLVVERRTNKVQLALVLNRTPDGLDAWRSFCTQLFTNPLWHSIWINCNTAKNNTIFGSSWNNAVGEEAVWEEIAGKEFAFHPAHFGQANLEMYERLINDIKKRVKKGAIIAELYAGIGIIGMSLVEQATEVRLCEVEPHAEIAYHMAKNRLPLLQQRKLSYHVTPAEKSFALLEGATTCIVDPPRKGVGKESLDTLLHIPSLTELIYVSCEWESLERDCLHILQHHPDWTVSDATSYLFFPGTNQIETVLFFRKKSG